VGKVLNILEEAKKESKTLIAVLADPDHYEPLAFDDLIDRVNQFADFLFIGGSHCLTDQSELMLNEAKKKCLKPLVLFPGPGHIVSKNADAILYLSLISGRNPELLIGWHVQNAYKLKTSGVEIISTGYILIDGGKPTSVSYVSNTVPIPAEKNGLIISTALAGELMGQRLIYLEAGSGALNPVAANTIKKVVENINVPLIVGGGIKTPHQAKDAAESGATLLVIGNALEKDIDLLKQIKEAI
jgi:putative glycerol-1-phosphate prenyltransferase